MNQKYREFVKQFLQLLGLMPLIAFSSVVISILAPTIVITTYAWFSESANDISRFAHTVAQPVAFISVLAWAIFLSRKKYRHVTSFSTALVSGLGTSFGLFFAAMWIGEVDKWAVTSIIIAPVVTIAYWKSKLRKHPQSIS